MFYSSVIIVFSADEDLVKVEIYPVNQKVLSVFEVNFLKFDRGVC